MKIVHGTAVASGIKVEGYEEWLKTAAVASDDGKGARVLCFLEQCRCQSPYPSWTDMGQDL